MARKTLERFLPDRPSNIIPDLNKIPELPQTMHNIERIWGGSSNRNLYYKI
jgi:hypothetical protein